MDTLHPQEEEEEEMHPRDSLAADPRTAMVTFLVADHQRAVAHPRGDLLAHMDSHILRRAHPRERATNGQPIVICRSSKRLNGP